MAPGDIAKTALITTFSLWEFPCMSFSLKNAIQACQRLNEGILRDVPFVFAYLDDVLAASKNLKDHYRYLCQIFQLLSTNGLVVNQAKSVFGVAELEAMSYATSTFQTQRPVSCAFPYNQLLSLRHALTEQQALPPLQGNKGQKKPSSGFLIVRLHSYLPNQLSHLLQLCTTVTPQL